MVQADLKMAKINREKSTRPRTRNTMQGIAPPGPRELAFFLPAALNFAMMSPHPL
jgi:hypothetical protein